LTAKADFGPGVNQMPAGGEASGGCQLRSESPQPHVAPAVVAKETEPSDGREFPADDRPGGHEAPNRVNHAQVVVPQGTQDEIQQLLARIGVNLEAARAGRKNVFDEFLRGRLVSLLAMGLSIRQSAAALGLSHNAVWKELQRNPEVSEQVNAARFQAQIEPLLVVMRESRRSWRAATWLLNYLGKQIGSHEETPDEARRRNREERTDSERYQAEYAKAKKQREEEEKIEEFWRTSGYPQSWRGKGRKKKRAEGKEAT
jgi:hypothetical protein